MDNMNLKNTKSWKILASGIMGALIGGSYMSNHQDNCRILYVAQDELMALEQERVKGENLSDRQLFFGNTEEAVRLATSLPKDHESHNTKVIYSMSSVTGENVHSISKEIHQEIIENLSKKKDKK